MTYIVIRDGLEDQIQTLDKVMPDRAELLGVIKTMQEDEAENFVWGGKTTSKLM